MSALSQIDLDHQGSHVNTEAKPRRGWIWIVSSVLIVVALVLFPPQRRAGIWTDSNDQSVSPSEAHRFDRFEFGYLPSFRWKGNVGKQEDTGIMSTVTLLETGPFHYKSYRWVIDWQWVVALIVVATLGVTLVAVAEISLLKAAAKAPPLSQSRRFRRWLVWGLAIVLSALGVAFIRSHIELRSDRERIASQCREWSQRVKRNPNDREALRYLVRVLKGKWSFAATYAAWALGDAGPNALPAIDDLIQVMNADEMFVSQEALKSVGKVSKGSDRGVDVLIDKLSEDWISASFAADGLGEIGAPAERAIPSLQRLAESSDNSTVVHSANSAIEEIQKAIKVNRTHP